MPIDADEWNKGRTDDQLKSKIESFLRKNEGQAFSAGEIINHLYQFKGEGWASFLLNLGSIFVVRNALKDLIKEETVKSKIIETPRGGGSDEFFMIS